MRFLVAASYFIFLAVLTGFLAIGQPALSPQVHRRTPRFQIERALADLRQIDDLTRAAGGRQVRSSGNALVRDYVGRELERAGLIVYEQTFGDLLGGQMRNIIGSLPGDRDETILLCGHHDAEDEGPSAVDGSAGLAILIESARVCVAAAKEARAEGRDRWRTVLFASWDGESFGCAGSSHFATSLSAKSSRKVRAVLSLDSVGWKDGTPVLHALPYTDRFGVTEMAPDWLVTRVSNAARRQGMLLPVGDRWLGLLYQVAVRNVDVGYYSDDRPFLAIGVPAVFISNLSLTSSYSRSGTVSDTIDQIGRAQLTSAGRCVEAALNDLAVADGLPPGERDYLVLRPPFVKSLRLTGDQLKALAVLSLLPGCISLVRGAKAGVSRTARALFLTLAVVFVLATMRIDPLLFPALFTPAFLASPLLTLRSPSAVWAHFSSMMPAFVFGVLLASVYVSGSGQRVLVGGLELAVLAILLVLGAVQVALHRARSRRLDGVVRVR